MGFWRRLTGESGEGGRVRGLPTSSNGASSFHLWWGAWSPPPGPDPVVEVSAVLEVVRPPQVGRLYFWALQVGFGDGRRSRGAGHLGLQWYPAHPGSTAVNWGGYADGLDGGGELAGGLSDLPSATGNVNTRDFDWAPGRPYRLAVARTGDRPDGRGRWAWEGSVTDLDSGRRTVVRDLFAPGDRLVSPVVWSEVFAACDDPSVVVRWSDLRGVTLGGVACAPDRVVTSFQSHADGGCANTTVRLAGDGVEQVTSVARTVAAGEALPWPPPG